MRFLVKVVIPTAAENAIVNDAKFDETLQGIFREVGGQATYVKMEDGRRVEYALIDIVDMLQITPVAKRIFDFLKVKPEFLPEIADDRFGY